MMAMQWLGRDERCVWASHPPIILAYHLWTRLAGLIIGKPRLLLIPYCKIVHTFLMSYEINIYFFDKDFNLIKTLENTLPNRIRFCMDAAYVLEVPSDFKPTPVQIQNMQLALRLHLFGEIFDAEN